MAEGVIEREDVLAVGRHDLAGRPAMRRLALARLVSAAGTQAARGALVYHLYEETGSTGWVSAVLLADILTLALVGPLAGWVGDRFDRRRVMVSAELAAAAVYLAMIPVQAPLLLVIGATLASALNSPFVPASSAAIPNLVGTDDLNWANSRISLATNGGLILGPVVGGALLSFAGLGFALAFNGLSFVGSALLVRRIVTSRASKHDRGIGGLTEGYAAIRSSRVLLSITLALALVQFTFGLALVADPVLAKDFNAGPLGYTLLYSTWGVVAMVGAWLAGRDFPARLVPYGIIGGLIAVSVACALIAILPWFWAIVTIGALGGVGSGMLFPLTVGLIQQHADDRRRARVFGVADMIGKSVYAVGMLVAARLVAALGAQPTYGIVAAGIGLAALGLAGLPRALRQASSTFE